MTQIGADFFNSTLSGTGFNGEGVFQPPYFRVMGDKNVPPPFSLRSWRSLREGIPNPCPLWLVYFELRLL